ncbi:hypothetical protein DLJ48_01810 [Oenococcus sicerae]|uniref:LPXTG cell wall anchor domain-containing protein n=1 Tax=Oenococcus sicerae TaxID=2203724 RepID=A0ABX5QKP2_9LACO|nr:SpaA isopeptide-forming pilin-related protein [Oenococcus sicerae]QAS69346.1 hypothetical protein DLJ48_01810 [Oenococcus sicerae]
MNKMFQRLYAILMALVISFQYVGIGAQAVSATTSDSSDNSIHLTSLLPVSGSTNEFTLKVHVTATTDSDYKIALDSPLAFKTAAEQQSKDTDLVSYLLNDDNVEIKAKAGTDNDVSISLNLDSSKIAETSQIKLTYETQSVSADIASQTAASSSSSSAASSSAATVKKAATVRSAAVTDPHDISQYLPASDNGTIIDSADFKFTDSKGNSVDPTKVDQNTNITLDYNWSIPNKLSGHTLASGDYFTFKLPAGVQYKAGQGDLGTYGTYTIAADGTVTFTFNDNVNTNDTISGTFGYTSQITSTTTTGEQTITIPTKTEPSTTTIVVNPNGGNTIAKTGTLTGANSSNNNPTGITWDVTINTIGAELDNATVIDPMPSSTDGTVPTTLKTTTIYPLTVNLNGNVTSTGPALVAGTDYTVDGSGKITFIGKYAKTYSAFKIEYTSDIDSSKLPDDGGQVSFKNTATLSNNGTNYPASATVDANYGKLIAKSYDGQDNNGSQKYNWHIDYNYGEKSLAANTSIVDTLSTGQAFSGTPTLVYEDGTTVDASLYAITYNSDKSQMTVTFPNGLTKGVKISYQSQLTDPNDTNTVISNSASSNGQTSDPGNQTVGQQGLTKSLGDVDYNSKTLTWNFDINMARQDMSNWSMTDTAPNGLTVIPTSFVLKDKDTGVTYKEGTDYTVTIDSVGSGFTIEFSGSLKSHAKDWYTLSYQTTFDTNNLPSSGKWTNNATTTWTDQSGKTHHNDGSADFTPNDDFKNDGSKSGAYNAVNKHITWTVVGNYNQRTLTSASIVDPIIGNQTYVADSAKLYEATINKDGSYNLGTQVTTTSINYDSGTKTITANLPEGSTKTYVLTFDTDLSGTLIGVNPSSPETSTPYTNTATYTNNSKSSDLTASISIPKAGEYVKKSGTQDPTNSAYATYHIWVNRSQSTLSNVVVDDVPDGKQIIDESSIVVYSTKVAQDGTVTEDTTKPLQLNQDYTVKLTTDPTTGQQELLITFNGQITTAYSIRYRSLINSSSTNDTLSNSVTITGDNTKSISQTTTTNTQVVNNSGSASGKNTNLVITKTDSASKKPLAGASFSLYSDNNGVKGQLLRSATTDANGQLTWNNLKSGNYILVETAAPDSYIIPTDLANGKEISVNYSDADSNNNVQLPESNTQGNITLTKTDSDTQAVLPGATFSLYGSAGNLIKAGLTTDANGQIKYSGLDAGSYYFVETSAPTGYTFDSSKHYTVTLNSDNISGTVNVADAEKTGSVILYKVDSDTNQALSGATFTLYKANGTGVASNLTTDAAGQIKVGDLKPGNYYFVETSAPAGYTFDSTAKYTFAITIGDQSQSVIVNAGNAEKRGSVVLTKTDADAFDPTVVAGAVFDLYKAGQSTASVTGLTTDNNGQIKVSGLQPGNYYFVETKAPTGYVLDAAHHNFTVAFDQVTAIGVSVADAEKTGSVLLTKTDSDTNKVLANAAFSLYKKDGTLLKSNLTTNANGQISYDGLKPGDYYFVETSAPAGYTFDSTKQYAFTIVLGDQTTPVTVSSQNAEKTHSVLLTKTDSSDAAKTLSGATFSLYKKDGSLVKDKLTTDAKGQLSYDGLKPGDYYFLETSAPAGYNFDSTKQYAFTIDISDSTDPVVVSAQNAEKTGSVVLTKTDAKTNKTLAGAVFDLYKANGTKIQSGLTTNAKGQIVVANLKPGDYYFVETKAPAGYTLNAGKHYAFTITIGDQTAAASVSVKDTKKPTQTAWTTVHKELPHTGEQVFYFSAITATMLAISAAAAALALKRKREQK